MVSEHIIGHVEIAGAPSCPYAILIIAAAVIHFANAINSSPPLFFLPSFAPFLSSVSYESSRRPSIFVMKSSCSRPRLPTTDGCRNLCKYARCARCAGPVGMFEASQSHDWLMKENII
jgi:hypothetical protein